MTDSEFMIRLRNHKQDFTIENLKNRTMLTQQVWKLKKEKADYDSK